MYGVTQATYDACRRRWGLPIWSVRDITLKEALRIFREEFWDKCKADQLHAGVDLAVYDASVNSGVSRGRKWLMAPISKDHPVSEITPAQPRAGHH